MIKKKMKKKKKKKKWSKLNKSIYTFELTKAFLNVNLINFISRIINSQTYTVHWLKLLKCDLTMKINYESIIIHTLFLDLEFIKSRFTAVVLGNVLFLMLYLLCTSSFSLGWALKILNNRDIEKLFWIMPK